MPKPLEREALGVSASTASAEPTITDPRVLLSVRDLKKYFPIRSGFFNKVVNHVKAVDGVSFDVWQGECLGLVGESGSGKTTVGRTLLRAYTPTGGSAHFQVRPGESVDLCTASKEQLRKLRPHMQMIFQDPYSSLNPRMTVADVVGEPLLIHGMKDRHERDNRVRELLMQVGLKETYLTRYPHAFSGGQRQRLGIARALALNPKLIVADEPVSALDVSVQAQVLNLLQDLQRKLGLTYIFVAHDLSVVKHICDRVAVMYCGQLVELAPVDALFDAPLHPYTEALLSAVPVPDPTAKLKRILLAGEVADPSKAPPGCPFHPRCQYAKPVCAQPPIPPLTQDANDPSRVVRCHFAGTLALQGIAK
jgi:peptide/nickel transport system ATP-binding protein